MRAVVQRVLDASVQVGAEEVARIGSGLVVLVGVGALDTEADARYVADKLAGLRIFDDDQGRLNLSVQDVQGCILLISQFTLYGDCRKGRRPSFTDAAEPARAEALYLMLTEELRQRGLAVQTGGFQASMRVALVNDGPVTVLLDSGKVF